MVYSHKGKICDDHQNKLKYGDQLVLLVFATPPSKIILTEFSLMSFEVISKSYLIFFFKCYATTKPSTSGTKATASWKVESKGSQKVELSGCDTTQIRREDELLIMITRGNLSDYGKYEILKVEDVSG